jgi:hypothetical protein
MGLGGADKERDREIVNIDILIWTAALWKHYPTP